MVYLTVTFRGYRRMMAQFYYRFFAHRIDSDGRCIDSMLRLISLLHDNTACGIIKFNVVQFTMRYMQFASLQTGLAAIIAKHMRSKMQYTKKGPNWCREKIRNKGWT